MLRKVGLLGLLMAVLSVSLLAGCTATSGPNALAGASYSQKVTGQGHYPLTGHQ